MPRTSDILAATPEQRRQMALRERLRGLGEADIVKAWYQAEEPFDLNEREDSIRKRWDFAKAQFLDRRTYGEIVASLQYQFGVSVAQARIDIRNMRHVFGPLDEVPKAAHRVRAEQMILKAYNMALQKEDHDAMTRATEVYVKITGIDRDDAERVDIEKLMKERTYVEVIDPTIRNLLLNFLAQSGGVVDSAALFERIYPAKNAPEFTDFEEISPGDNGEQTHQAQ